MQSPNVWDDPKIAEALGREKSHLEKVVRIIERLSVELEETRDLLELASTAKLPDTQNLRTYEVSQAGFFFLDQRLSSSV